MTIKKSRTKQVGQILIDRGLLTAEQLQQALDAQMQEGGLLGQILVKLQLVTQEQLDQCLSDQVHTPQNLENVLHEMGMLTLEQVDLARSQQRIKNSSMAQVIVELELLSETDLVSALVTQYGFPFLELANYEIETEIVQLVPRDIAAKYSLIPLDKIGNILTISIADPLNSEAFTCVRKLTGLDVESFIATFSDIHKAIEQYYQ